MPIKYPYSMFVMHIDEPTSEYGELLAVSSSRDSYMELCEFTATVRKPLYCLIGGFYGDLPAFASINPIE